MTFLPIAERELRIAARRAAPRYVRLVVAAVALLIGIFQISLGPIFSSSGSVAFGIMTGYAFLLCVGAGVFVTADCLSDEKRSGTLGLLFLTDLRGCDVVLGKLTSQFVYLGYALLAIIPAASLPLLLGGVTGGELWRISLALMNLLFFSLATGVLASSVCREAGRAMMLTAALLAIFCLALPFSQSALRPAGSSPPGLWLGWASPALAYVKAMESVYFSAGNQFWISLCGSHGVAWFLIAMAGVLVPRTWQDRPDKPLASVIMVKREVDASVHRRNRNREILNEDPLLWLIGVRKGMRAVVWVLSALWSVVVLSVGVFATSDFIVVVAIIGWIGLLLMKVLFAVEACRFFTETRRAGAFELLLATPIDANRFISSQWTALRRIFLPPTLSAVVCSVLVVGISLVFRGDGATETSEQVFWAVIITSIILVAGTLDFLALGWLGMWLALTMRKPQLAVGATLLYVVILPWVACSASPFIGFFLDIVLIAMFMSKLRADMRQVVMNRPLLGAGGSSRI